jgi:hypothetical protein
MKKLGAYKWSLLSFGISAVHVCFLYGMADYLYRVKGVSIAKSPYFQAIDWFHVAAILIAAFTAGVAISIESRKIPGSIALVLALLSYFCEFE